MPNVTESPNVSTEHRPSGAALNPSDTLDKPSAATPPSGAKTDVAEDIGPGNMPDPNAPPANGLPPAGHAPGLAENMREDDMPPAREVDPGFATNGE